jgi:hypothetical protein
MDNQLTSPFAAQPGSLSSPVVNKEDQNSLQLILKTYKLKSIKIKKNSTLNLLNNLEYIHLKNIFKNNIIIITSTSNEFFFNQNTLNIFENIKSIYFIGA